MEHEFVPGKRRCKVCRMAWREVFDTGIECFPHAVDEPQVWHLNVWTSVNGVIFTGQKAITQKDADALSWRFRLMEEGKGPADMPLDGVETALVNSLIQLISEIRANKPAEETE